MSADRTWLRKALDAAQTGLSQPAGNVVDLPRSLDHLAADIRRANNKLVTAQADVSRADEDWATAQREFSEHRAGLVQAMDGCDADLRRLQQMMVDHAMALGIAASLPPTRQTEDGR